MGAIMQIKLSLNDQKPSCNSSKSEKAARATTEETRRDKMKSY